MDYQLLIRCQQQPEMLERILRVTRHRGFSVSKLQAELDAQSPSQLSIALTVVSERPIHLLVSQLEKLYKVENVTLQVPQTSSSSLSSKL